MDKWRQHVHDTSRALQQQFLSDKSVTLYETLGSHVVDASTGGVLFWVGVSGAQMVQKVARIGAAAPVVPKVVGAVAVAASSAVALHFASLPREIYEDLALQKHRGDTSSVFSYFWSAKTQEGAGTVATMQQKLETRVEDFRDAPYPVYMLMGVLCFKMLGGRMNSLAPSNFSNLGAFHLKKASLPATADYATPIERGIIQEFGRLYGCHTCGVKRGFKYHADHMPPKLVAQRMNKNIFRRLFGQKVAFRFYPQCEPCSNQQGTVVKQWKSKLRTHLLSLRLYHSTGLWLVLLCTGGLYVGGSNFHEMSDVPSLQQQQQATESDDLLHYMNHHATSEHSLLVSLRERETKLKRQLKRTKGDASHAAAINAEIDSIVQCKKSLKANMKRQNLPPKVYARIRAGDSHQAIMDSIAESLQNRFRLFRVTVKRQLAEGGSGDRKVPVCQEFMATPSREKLAKKLLNHQATPSGSGGMSKRRHPSTLNLPQRGHHLQRLPSPTEQQLQQRESGWNDRFFYEQPINSNKLPRPDRTPASPQKQSAAAVQHRKEKKVRNERLQYGNSEIKRKVKESKQPANGRLMPLNVVSDPASLHPSKEERLRVKVLKAIDARENLLYQLNALILCTPPQEALFQPSRPVDPPSSSTSGFQRMRAKAGMALAPAPSSRSGTSGAMTNSREATKLAQKLAEDLQLAGIQCVEAIVEWMLEAGAKAEKPPPFLWRERNYFLKMYSDLDFAQPELEARGVDLECYTRQNPLLIRANQKLGRVLAAQAIITEMVEMATDTKSPAVAVVDHGFEKHPEYSNEVSLQHDESEGSEPEDHKPSGDASSMQDLDTYRTSQQSDSADVMILQNDDDEQESEAAEGEGRAIEGDREQEGDYGSEGGDVSVLPSSSGVDASSTDELVDILDESLSDLVRPSPPIAPVRDEPNMLTVVTPRENERSASEYDNSFEDDAEDENQQSHEKNTADAETGVSPEENHENLEESERPEKSEQLEADEAAVEPPDDFHEDNQSPESPTTARTVPGAIPPSAVSCDDDAGDLPHRLLEEMQRLSRITGADSREDPNVDIAGCLSWSGSGAIMVALGNREPIDRALRSSFYAALDHYQLSPSSEQTRDLLRTPVAKEIKLDEHLLAECLSIADSVYDYLASQIQLAFERGNSLISEIELDEAIDLAEATLIGIHQTTWGHLRNAIDFLKLAHSNDRSARCTSRGVSNLVKVFYPYLVNLPREKLSSSWRRIAQLFGSMSPDLDALFFSMDPTCKVLLLAANLCGSSSGGNASVDENEERGAMSYPKLTIVCQRGNVLETSVAALWSKVFAKKPARSQYLLYPFFQSSFGEKVVDGLKVEEGEGKGPLREWVSLVTSEMAANWSDVLLDTSFREGTDAVEANGNKLAAPGLTRTLQPGFEVSWLSSDEESVSRVINKIVDQDTVLLDRGVSAQSFPISELKVRRPRPAFLEYIKASESFWLSSQTQDSPGNRRVLYFYGWYLGMVVSHYSKIDLRLHQLFFSFLLDERFRVALDDVQSLDPSLYDSLMQMKKMSPSDFAAFLELEGGDTSFTVDEYVLQVVEEKFGVKSCIWWQFGELRAGFQRVFSLDELKSAGIEPTDLVEVICGAPGDTDAQHRDFNIDEVFRVALDPDFVKCVPLRRVFWRVVNAFDPQLKRKLVKFITGVDALPLPGTEFLRIEMPFAALTAAENQKVLQMLPQAHTCDNTLELPHYWRALCWKEQWDDHKENEDLEVKLAALLRKKLQDAAEYSGGYGLDGTSTVAGVLPERAERRAGSSTSRSELAKDESYDSLDLPAIGDEGDSVGGHASRVQTPSLLAAGAPFPHAHEDLELSVEVLDEPAHPSPGPETPAVAEETSKSETAAFAPSSPKRSARHRDDADESYEENDWEEEEELLE